ncbi:hypothetical protein NQZ68_025432 [Dissostichus eleginoides]|nr:hypothetical protein NQZ68_025432 [Dissostichus eleginoides]
MLFRIRFLQLSPPPVGSGVMEGGPFWVSVFSALKEGSTLPCWGDEGAVPGTSPPEASHIKALVESECRQ